MTDPQIPERKQPPHLPERPRETPFYRPSPPEVELGPSMMGSRSVSPVLRAESLTTGTPTTNSPSLRLVETTKGRRRKSTPLFVRNRKEVQRYSWLLIHVLQEALDYDPLRQNNQTRPELRISDDPEYLQELRSLVAELHRLNELLALEIVSRGKATREVVHIAKHFDSFLASYAGAMGKLTAGLTGGAVVALIYQTGIGKEFIDHIWAHTKFPD